MMDDLQVPEESTESSPSKLPLIALIVAAFGIIAGVGGIVMANGAQTAMRDMENRIATMPNPADDLRAEMAALEKRLGQQSSAAVSRVTDLESQLVRTREQTQAAFTSMTRDVRENREQINAATRELAKVNEALQAPASTRSSASYTASSSSATTADTATASSSSDASSDASGGRVYRIQSGDTLNKLATRFNTSLDTILRLNPGVDPRKLQIGQEIVLPQE